MYCFFLDLIQDSSPLALESSSPRPGGMKSSHWNLKSEIWHLIRDSPRWAGRFEGDFLKPSGFLCRLLDLELENIFICLDWKWIIGNKSSPWILQGLMTGERIRSLAADRQEGCSWASADFCSRRLSSDLIGRSQQGVIAPQFDRNMPHVLSKRNLGIFFRILWW